jgi:hypothetical protein
MFGGIPAAELQTTLVHLHECRTSHGVYATNWALGDGSILPLYEKQITRLRNSRQETTDAPGTAKALGNLFGLLLADARRIEAHLS